MAIDSQAKRGAALGFSSRMLPFPDGAIDDDDQYALIGLYPFAADTGASSSPYPGRFLRMGRRRGLLL